jgi:chorismate lyase/3-hydroxybenzoate synthase
MNTAAALRLDYVCADQLVTQSNTWWQSVLGVVGFEKRPHIDHAWVPITASMTPSLGAAENLCEVWSVSGNGHVPLSNGVAQGRIHYRFCEEFLFGSMTIDEQALNELAAARGGVKPHSGALLRATESAYREIFEVLGTTEHRHLIRIWNYLPDINREADGDERYRHFNSARQSAFRLSGRTTVGSVPAASALGSPAGSPISIYFLAARHPPMMIENPRQTSAYFYPPKFGAHSPVFSRACVLRDADGTTLFVSGTASIVGHETIHQGDVVAQTHETLANIRALLDEANRVVGSARYSLDALKLKVYVRQPRDLTAIDAALTAALPGSTSIVYLQADVCREELLVEIEATGDSEREAQVG